MYSNNYVGCALDLHTTYRAAELTIIIIMVGSTDASHVFK